MPLRFIRNALLTLAAVQLAAAASAEDSWPQFRGPTGQGIATAENLPLTWSETENIAWKTPIPGKGWSSPVVMNGQVWLTTALDTPLSKEEREKRLAGDPFAAQLALAGELALRAVCVDLASGKILHDIKLFDAANPEPIHSTNTYASPTPIIERSGEGGKLYCHFGRYGTACVDTKSGEILWKTKVPIQHNVGPGSSPVLFDNLLILTCDGVDAQFMTALDTSSGATVWKTTRPKMEGDDGDHHKAFATPLVIDVAGEPQLIAPGAQWFVAYNPRTGETIWQINHGRGFSNVPRPVVGHGMVYLCTGFMEHQLWAVRLGGKGELADTHVAWREKKQIPDQTSPVLIGNRLYTISGQGVVTCFDAITGESLWRDRVAGNYSASPLAVGDRLYLFSREGNCTVLKDGTKSDKLSQNSLEGQIMASPAVVGDSLIVRTDSHLYRIQQANQ